MENILTVIFLSIFSGLYAQNSVSFVVVDSITKQPASFLKIFVAGKDNGTYSDAKGFVEMNDLSNNDTLFIDNIFCEKKMLQIKKLYNIKQIVLSPKPYMLNEVLVKPSKSKGTEIGYSKIRSNTNFGVGIIGTEMAVLIEPGAIQNLYINVIILKIKKHPRNNPYVRVHLYLNDKGNPGTEIYLKNNLIIVYEKDKIIFNIENQSIKLPINGVFISMEWIGNYNENGEVYKETALNLNPSIKSYRTTNKKSKGIGFLRKF